MKGIQSKDVKISNLNIPLSEVYEKIVSSLIHSPAKESDRDRDLSRDTDPESFQLFLAEEVGDDDGSKCRLDLMDIACQDFLDDTGRRSILPYMINMHSHMIQKVSVYLESCVLNPSSPSLQPVSFGQKKKFFRSDIKSTAHEES